MEIVGQTITGETGTMPPSSTPEVWQIEVLCVMLLRMPSPTEIGHQEKEEDEEREEDPRVTAS